MVGNRLSTAVGPLDDALEGGLPSGSLVAVQAPPESQSRALLRAGREQRPTYYITTILSTRAVENMFEQTGDSTNYEIVPANAENALEDLHEVFAKIDTQSNVVVDAANPLESASTEEEYLNFLKNLTATLEETGSIGFLHCLEDGRPPQHRDLSLSVAEFVWSLDIETKPNSLDFYLKIPKARAMMPEERILNLELGEDIKVDTSRDIA